MTSIISLQEVTAVRRRIANAHALAAERFRAAFDASHVPAHERWRTHLEIQAAALLECADLVKLRGGLTYAIDGRTVQPYVTEGAPIYGFFDVPRVPAAIFEYWMIVSEISASPSWSVTKVVAAAEELDAALQVMVRPQMLRALIVSFLPAVEITGDRATLEVTVYTRAGEERIERRVLTLDENNEFHFHSREMLAEGRGGVEV